MNKLVIFLIILILYFTTKENIKIENMADLMIDNGDNGNLIIWFPLDSEYNIVDGKIESQGVSALKLTVGNKVTIDSEGAHFDPKIWFESKENSMNGMNQNIFCLFTL